MHGNGMILNFGLVVVAAALAALLFRALKLPVLFGYIAAGLLLGPHLLPVPLIADAGAVGELSELGVIFLLFFLGMEFDLRRLQSVLGPALVALVLQTVLMIYLARFASPLLGWSPLNTLFFGSLLAISSSMVTVRVLREQNQLQSPHAQLAIGILILEDVLAVILLVILTGAKVNRRFDWDAAWLVTFLMGVFVVVVFLAGRVLIPRLLQRLDREQHADEALTLASLGLVMGISVLALKFHFSPALGAFVAGAMLAQTRVTHRVETITRSLHDLFAAVFFTTVGMRIDPRMLVGEAGWILFFTVLVIGGKVLACWTGLVLAGARGRNAFRAAVAKAQIGEFSFIIAGIGVGLGVMDERTTAIAFGVAFLSILLAPALNARSVQFHRALLRRMPRFLPALGRAWQRLLEGLLTVLGRNVLLRLLRRPTLQILLYFFVVNGILIGVALAAGFVGSHFSDPRWAGAAAIGLWAGAGIAAAPFVIAMGRNLNALTYIVTEAMFRGRGSRPVYYRKMRQVLGLFVSGFYTLFMVLHFFSIAAPSLPGGLVFAGLALLIILGLLAFWRKLVRINSQMEWLFIESFQEDVRKVESEHRAEVLRALQARAPWPVNLREVVLPERAAARGMRIRDLDLRARFAVNVLALRRGGLQVFDPSPDSALFPGDALLLLGADQANRAAENWLGTVDRDARPRATEIVELVPVYLSSECDLDGNTLAGAHIRERFGITVVGIQRGDEQIQNPGPEEILGGGDVLYVVGHPRRIERFRHTVEPATGSAEVATDAPLPIRAPDRCPNR
jgi:CPA2 family monovalent cation:H+ antiporter-2